MVGRRGAEPNNNKTNEQKKTHKTPNQTNHKQQQFLVRLLFLSCQWYLWCGTDAAPSTYAVPEHLVYLQYQASATKMSF